MDFVAARDANDEENQDLCLNGVDDAPIADTKPIRVLARERFDIVVFGERVGRQRFDLRQDQTLDFGGRLRQLVRCLFCVRDLEHGIL